jgi:hypothetical protein
MEVSTIKSLASAPAEKALPPASSQADLGNSDSDVQHASEISTRTYSRLQRADTDVLNDDLRRDLAKSSSLTSFYPSRGSASVLMTSWRGLSTRRVGWMLIFAARKTSRIAVSALCATLMPAWPAMAALGTTSIPDFSGPWARTTLGYESPLSGHGRGGIENRMHRPNGASNLSMLMGDYSDALLKPKAAELLKKRGEISSTGVAFPQPANQCLPEPPPYISSNNQEIELLQEKNRVTILNMFDHQFRHVRLNVQHPAHPTPTWYGDSVGHYEGDSLVVDTIGIKVGEFSMVDMYGTPFSLALHVVERFRLVDGVTAKAFAERGERENGRITGENGDGVEIDLDYKGNGLQLEITVEDPGVFTRAWSATVTYRRPLADWAEMVCAENIHEYYAGKETTIPTADKPDF